MHALGGCWLTADQGGAVPPHVSSAGRTGPD